ncbi:hypothetical protein HPB47_005377 [Ixodes persulcatus]|uniref:Uncharacterized protein n=1 Tax=Ixodes persulcatus TaxID=34615 RepID=A0AC60PD39_IXOPE|nr:hypothetical protein HPB47_005377 [Ixodes persulcatus]
MQLSNPFRFFMQELFCVGRAPGFIDVLEFQDYSEASLKPHVPADTTEEVVMMLYTSGTTGLPKAVEISHKAYVSCYRAFIGASRSDVYEWASFPGDAGETGSLGGVVALETLNVVVTASEIHAGETALKRASVGVVAEWALVGRSPHVGLPRRGLLRADVLDLSFLASSILWHWRVSSGWCRGLAVSLRRSSGNGGVAQSRFLWRRRVDRNLRLEGSVNFLSDDLGERYGDSLGPYQKGEIVVQGRTLMKGYYHHPEATLQILNSDGWLRTGDLGYYDSNGQMYFVDRIKQMIKCMGNIVTPAELEEILTTHEAVLEAAVVGIPSSKYGEAPVACVVIKGSQEEGLDSLEQELKKLVAVNVVNSGGRLSPLTSIQQNAPSSPPELFGIPFSRLQLLASERSEILKPVTELKFLDIDPRLPHRSGSPPALVPLHEQPRLRPLVMGPILKDLESPPLKQTMMLPLIVHAVKLLRTLAEMHPFVPASGLFSELPNERLLGELQFGVGRLQHRWSAIVLSSFKEMVAGVGLLAAKPGRRGQRPIAC